MPRRLPPPPLEPGPLTRAQCDALNQWVKEVNALLGGFGAAPPLNVDQDSTGVRYSLDAAALQEPGFFGTSSNPVLSTIGPHVNLQFRGHTMHGETLVVWDTDHHDFPLPPETTYLNVRVVNPAGTPDPAEAAFGVRLTGAGGITGALHWAVLSTVPGETGVSSGGTLYTNPGRMLFVVNRSPDNILTIAHESTDSLPGNRFYLPGLADLVLAPGEGMGFYYSGYPESIFDFTSELTTIPFADLLADANAANDPLPGPVPDPPAPAGHPWKLTSTPHYAGTLEATFSSAGRWMPLDKGTWLEQTDAWNTSQNNYPLEPGKSLLTVDVTNGVFLTGLAGGHAGRVLWLANNGTDNVNHLLILRHAHADSLAENRLSLPKGADIALLPGESIGLYYSPSDDRWHSLDGHVPWTSLHSEIDQDENNFIIGTTEPFRVLEPVTANRTITGFDQGYDGRVLWITNPSAEYTLTLTHDDIASDAENRMLLPGGANIVLGMNESVGLFYHGADQRWHCLDLKRGSLTVKEVDGTPTVIAVSELQFNQDDGFVVTEPSPGVARIGFTNPGGGGATGYAHVYRNTNQSNTNSTLTPVQFNQVVVDSDGFFDAGTPSRLTIPTGGSGFYNIGGTIRWASDTSLGTRQYHAYIRKNGSSSFYLAAAKDYPPNEIAVVPDLNVVAGSWLEAGDYVELVGLRVSGTTQDYTAMGLILGMWIARR